MEHAAITGQENSSVAVRRLICTARTTDTSGERLSGTLRTLLVRQHS